MSLDAGQDLRAKLPCRTDVLVESLVGHPPGPLRNSHRPWYLPTSWSRECSGLTGDTRAATDRGLIALRELVSDSRLLVLDGYGRWSHASVYKGQNASMCGRSASSALAPDTWYEPALAN